MSATNKTQHYNLPQFVAGDIPAWMTDVNNAMATIDGAIYDVASDEATVGESVAQLGSRVTSAENTVASLGTTVQGVQSDVAENTADIATLEGNVNGLGTRTTTVEGKVTTLESKVATLEGETAEDIPYDNTDSGLTATDVQSAIDELAQGGTGFSAPDYANGADDTATTITATSLANAQTVFTATDDCYASIHSAMQTTGISDSIIILINGKKLMAVNAEVTTEVYNLGYIIVPLKQGDIITAYKDSGVTSASVYVGTYPIR